MPDDIENHASDARQDDATNAARARVGRRAFLKVAGAATAGAVAAVGAEPFLGTARSRARAATKSNLPIRRNPGTPSPSGTYAPLRYDTLRARQLDAASLRIDRAEHWGESPLELVLANDDELRYPDGWANFSKSLPHDALGHPDPAAFKALVRACQTGDPKDFAAIPLGGKQPLRNPQGGFCFDFCGPDANQTLVPPAPAFASAWRAGEMVEVYWAALLRDVPFADYASDPMVARACADLSALTDFRGPSRSGAVTPDVLFRGTYPGCQVGPFLSQFLLKDVAFGAQINAQQVRVFAPDSDALTTYDAWLARQNGAPFGARVYDPTFRYMRNLRDLASWVDADPPLQAGYHALSILLQMHCPLDPANPYLTQITNQDAFTTFGPVELFDMVGRAPRPAHEAVWFQKWRIHRSLRPEEFAARVHNQLVGAFDYPLDADVLNSDAVQQTFAKNGTYLCSSAYPEGAPTHTAYPSGHSVGVGSTVTMLKAAFDESFVIPNPVEPSADGLSLQPYSGPPLTVGGELNKLALNIGVARVVGGIHWRSDVLQGNKLGEAVSIGILQDMKTAYNEPFSGYTLTSLEGDPITT
jgi:membrane-associated phospholipid phosphatase